MDRVQGARELQRLRESRGWSWAELSRALRATARDLSITAISECQIVSLQRNVARWESGRSCPNDRYQLLLAHLYRADLSALTTALAHFGVSEDRLTQLMDLVACVDHVSAERSPAEFAAVVRRINASVGGVPFVRLQLELAPVVAHIRHTIRRPPDDLLAVATAAFSLAARLAFETRDDAAAMALYAEAVSAADGLADRHHCAAVRTSYSMVALHSGRTSLAREIAAAAVKDAHAGTSYGIRARAHAVHAEISSLAGAKRTAAAALESAWKTVDQLAVGDPHAEFDARRLDGFQALFDLHVGDAAQAQDRLVQSVEVLRGPRDSVQRGINTSDLALARLRLGDPAACADLLHEAVNITACTGGRVPGQRVRHVRRELRPWRAEPFVADLDDHIHDTLIGR